MAQAAVRKAETAEKPWLWGKGQSGNPAGRPKGSKGQASLWAERFAEVAGEAEARRLMRLLLDKALAGESWALRFCLSRLLAPAKHRPVHFELPAPTGRGAAADAAAALASLLAAVAAGEVAPEEAKSVAALIAETRQAAE